MVSSDPKLWGQFRIPRLQRRLNPSPHEWNFYHSWILHLALSTKDTTWELISRIQRAAEILSVEIGESLESTTSAYCWMALECTGRTFSAGYIGFRRNILREYDMENRFIDSDTELLAGAAYFNHVPFAKKLIDRGCIPCLREYWPGMIVYSPAEIAAARGSRGVVELFLSKTDWVIPSQQLFVYYRPARKVWRRRGAFRSPNAIIRYNSIDGAISGGDIPTIELVMQKRWQSDVGVIIYRNAYPDYLQYFIGVLQQAKPTDKLDILNNFSGDIPFLGFTSQKLVASSFIDSAKLGDTSSLEKFSHLGADTPLAKGIALWQACRHCHENVVDRLLESGADPNFALTHYRRPLMAAAASGSLAIVRKLLDHGALVNEGHTPAIVYAIRLEHIDMFNLLRERGAVIHTKPTGNVAMKDAAWNGLESMLAVLLGEGLTIAEYEREYVIRKARERGHEGTAKMLELSHPS
jgi:hypothetical protein